jgi:hypothetical protein
MGILVFLWCRNLICIYFWNELQLKKVEFVLQFCTQSMVLSGWKNPPHKNTLNRQPTQTDTQNFSLLGADPGAVYNFSLTKEAVYILHNIQAHSCIHCCSGKAISVIHPRSVFVALGIQHTMHMCHIFTCGLLHSYNIFPHYLINGMILGWKKVIEYEMCFSAFSTTFVWNIFHSKKKWARYGQKCILVFMLHEDQYTYNIPFIPVRF